MPLGCGRRRGAGHRCFSLLLCGFLAGTLGQDKAEDELVEEKLVEKKLAPVPFEASVATLESLHPCDDYDEPDNLCVSLTFTEGPTDEANLDCKAFQWMPQQAPEWEDFWYDAQPQMCNTSGKCKVYIEDRILPRTEYFVFCVQMRFSLAPPQAPIVKPTCDDKSEPCGVKVKTARGAGPNLHDRFGVTDLCLVVLLMLYVFWSYVFERVRIVHETGVAAIAGLVLGCILKYISGKTATFSYEMFSFILLPAVIFQAGFNLQKKHFFQYFGYIVVLGVLGTMMIFMFIFFGASWFDFEMSTGQDIKLDLRHRVLMASVLASTDSVAPISFLPPETFPQLYAVVFGEGVINDVVSILLSTAASQSASLPKFGELCWKILYFLTTSGLMGLTFGFGTAYIFKRVKQLHDGEIKPCVLLLLSSYTCYVFAEILELSSIFALFVCSILCGHYAKYSISGEACRFSEALAEFLSYVAEAFVFGYFGLTAVGYFTDPAATFSWQLIWFYFFCILLSRAVSVFLLAVMLRLARCGERLRIKTSELFVIGFAGCMRGTIAYALILRSVPPEELQHPEDTLMVTTVLGLILINTIVLGSLFPLMLKVFGISEEAVANRMSEISNVSFASLSLRIAAPAVEFESQVPPGAMNAPIDDQLSPLEAFARAAQQPRPHARIRRSIHGAWHRLDDRILKPTFRARPTLSPESSEAQVAASASRETRPASPARDVPLQDRDQSGTWNVRRLVYMGE